MKPGSVRVGTAWMLALASGALPLALAAEPPSHPTLAVGAAAPDFDLPGTDGKPYTLASFAQAKVLVLVFTANHCPTAQAYQERIEKLHADFGGRGAQVVLVSPNEPLALRLDEQGYSDLGDTLPHRLLVAPGGRVLYRSEGAFDTRRLRKAIVGWLGRYYHSAPGGK